MSQLLQTILLLFGANIFMTFAWYGHLRDLNREALWIAIAYSWGIALIEYLFLIPANRIGFCSGVLNLTQLKILQEVISLGVFVPFAVWYMHESISWNFLWAGLCLTGAVYFIFK